LSFGDRATQLKKRATRIPGCVVSAARSSLDEIESLTRRVQTLRRHLTA